MMTEDEREIAIFVLEREADVLREVLKNKGAKRYSRERAADVDAYLAAINEALDSPSTDS